MALLEFDSISAGIVAGDAMVKSSPIGAIFAGTVHPGRYLVLVTGDTASVAIAVETGAAVAGDGIADSVFLPDIHPDVAGAMTENSPSASLTAEALGIVETTSVAAVLDAADAGAKAAAVAVASVRLADGLGGKAYVLFSGTVAEVESAVEAAVARAVAHDALIRSDVISQLHGEMAANLATELRFMKRIGS